MNNTATNDSKIKSATGLISVNSIAYVEQLFDLYDANETAVLIKNKTQTNQINGIILNDIIEPSVKTGWFKPSTQVKPSNVIAQISFTSGTEGEPKAIALSHAALENTASRLVMAMHMDSSIKEYIGAPVNFSFGLGRCRAISHVGGMGYLPPNGFDPMEIRRMLAGNEINAISAVPTLWRVVLDNKQYFEEIGSKLKWIEIGSQYMSGEEKILLRKIFPNAKIIQHYGLTEASRTTLLDISVENEALESVGKPSPDIEVKLNEESKICIKGPHLCSGIVVNGEVKNLNDQDGWFETSDFGGIQDGFLYYKGRSDDIINCGGIKASPEMLEREMRLALNDSDIGFCIAKISDEERGEMPLLAILKDSSDKQDVVKSVALQELGRMGLNLSNLPMIVIDELPKTATGKVQRKKISSQYQPPAVAVMKKKNKKATSIREIFEGLLGEKNLRDDSSFDSMGGDSLNYVRASMQIEEYLGYLPKDWNKLSLSTLDKKTISTTRGSFVETNILLRSLAIVAVVIGHSGFSIIGGGTQLLIILVGFNLARFQSSKMLAGEVWSSIYKFSTKLIVPYLILVVAYFIWKNSFSWDRIFMYTNYMPMDGRTPVIFPDWFIQVLVQSLIIIGLMFSFENVRKKFIKHLWGASFTVLVLLITLRVVFPYVYNTHYLYQRVPPIYLASIWLGWVIYTAESKNQKVATFIAALILSYAHLGLSAMSLWISAGAFLLLFIHQVKLTKPFKVVITKIASATFYIYLFHMIFIHIPANVLKLNSPLMNAIFGILGSIAVCYLFERQETKKVGLWISTCLSNLKLKIKN